MSNMNAAAAGSSGPIAKGTAVKIIASVVAVVAAVGTLLWQSAAPGAEYYKHVDEVMSRIGDLRGKKLQVHGYVVPGSIVRKPDALDYRFKLETRPPRAPALIEAEYRGIVPDNFKSDAEVVAKGSLTADNRLVVVPDGISAKCPSKYEAQAPKLQDVAGAGVPGPSTARK
jgi:cytochrome c-type biogenesis protein CcmE